MKLCLSIFLLITTLNFEDYSYNFESLVPISKIYEGEETKYLFLSDDKQNQWILKQSASDEAETELELLYEIIASQISEKLQIPINHVELISASSLFPSKIYPNKIASLHLKIPGIPTSENYPWPNFDVHQKCRTKWMEEKNGPLPTVEKGLRKVIIENMARSSQLAQIVALDTYLGNMDRSHPNLFYDTQTESFYGIDMGNTFRANLAHEALLSIQNIKDQKILLSESELNGLKVYQKTLKNLTLLFPPETVVSLLKSFINKADFSSEILNDCEFRKKLDQVYNLITQSFHDTQNLIDELESLLRN